MCWLLATRYQTLGAGDADDGDARAEVERRVPERRVRPAHRLEGEGLCAEPCVVCACQRVSEPRCRCAVVPSAGRGTWDGGRTTALQEERERVLVAHGRGEERLPVLRVRVVRQQRGERVHEQGDDVGVVDLASATSAMAARGRTTSAATMSRPAACAHTAGRAAARASAQSSACARLSGMPSGCQLCSALRAAAPGHCRLCSGTHSAQSCGADARAASAAPPARRTGTRRRRSRRGPSRARRARAASAACSGSPCPRRARRLAATGAPRTAAGGGPGAARRSTSAGPSSPTTRRPAPRGA